MKRYTQKEHDLRAQHMLRRFRQELAAEQAAGVPDHLAMRRAGYRVAPLGGELGQIEFRAMLNKEIGEGRLPRP